MSTTAAENPVFDYDYIVIGSGFGGSVSALRLSEKGYRVAVLEMGRRWTPENLPHTSWNLANWFWRPKLGLRGFFNMRFFRHVTVLHGCAVGGGSITYGSTLLRPPEKVWRMGSWSGLAAWEVEMPRHYAEAERMLGVVENRILGPSDRLLRETAEACGVGETFYRTRVGILQGPEGDSTPRGVGDPFFGGRGPARTTCNGCGGCMMGCRNGAKNTLDQNYLYLAEGLGAQVFPETQVVDVRPLDGRDGETGYAVETVCSTSLLPTRKRRFTARAVMLAASSLGTTELLFRLREKGSLSRLSPQLGRHIRTNSESLIGVRIPDCAQDLSKGVAIGSGVYIDEHTHIEAVRYPSGSDSMSLLSTILTGGRPGHSRVALWMRTLGASLLRHPWKTLRLLWPACWARECIILLCMQAVEAHLDMRWQRNWWWPWRKTMNSHGERVPTFIPAANRFAQQFAARVGGTAMSMIPEILFDVPGTAHCLGGCVMGRTAEEGVVDEQHRVFGYRNLYICDGSVVSANLGVNPSLTIAALAERAMARIPEKENRAVAASCGAGGVA